LGLTTPRDSSIAASSVARRSGQLGGARSAARTNEVDRDEQRRTSGDEEAPETRPQKGARSGPSQPRPAGERLDGTKGRNTRRFDYGGPARITPLLAWRPALRHYGSPNDAS
jgi:hypothetical protein